MKLFSYLIAFLILSLQLGSPAYAENSSWVDDCNKSLESGEPLFDYNCRKSLARDIFQNHKKALNLLPTLSPKEIEWVQSETADMGLDKYRRAVQSTEYAIYKVRMQLEQSAFGAEHITKNELTLTHELYLWAQIFSVLNEFEAYYPDKLAREGHLNTKSFAQALGYTTKTCGDNTGGGNSFGECLEVGIKSWLNTAIMQRILIPGLQKLHIEEINNAK